MQKSPLVEVGEVKLVTLPNIKVPHCCSTRVGGVSQDHLGTLNAGFTVGDQTENVWRNRERIARHLGVPNLPWLLSMTHGKEVVRIDSAAPLPQDLAQRPTTSYSADGCITNVRGLPLTLTVADCVPVFFHDPVAGAIGVSHAGWRGTVAGIVKETVEAMVRNYGSKPTDVQVGIGPSIGPGAFEVGPEVLSEFEAEFPESGVVRTHPDAQAADEGKGFVDLWVANTLMARRAGVPLANIEVSGWCTVSHPDLFFSHRRDQGRSGRLLAGIVLT